MLGYRAARSDTHRHLTAWDTGGLSAETFPVCLGNRNNLSQKETRSLPAFLETDFLSFDGELGKELTLISAPLCVNQWCEAWVWVWRRQGVAGLQPAGESILLGGGHAGTRPASSNQSSNCLQNAASSDL